MAAINGNAVGTGYTLACAADARIISGGVIQPSSGSTVRYSPSAAVAVGLADYCCAPAELIGTALRQASRCQPAGIAPFAVSSLGAKVRPDLAASVVERGHEVARTV
ncbi:hypothetical protein [Amycolatopsis taiwanensis]|uniref:Uncharacterized protein n=1 Tax=Amycolatopsis taiwanensis TaxID=342230 RepID=A0A9W6VI20_9PSEU|nr:hypothetical protein [Amycolatopsis taiwanensis]GLY67929.1 hypothetical protein Atai01_45480 [Amycolatopsis taiwanensis]